MAPPCIVQRHQFNSLPLAYTHVNGFWDDLLLDWVSHLMSLNSDYRPDAKEASPVFATYALLLSLIPPTAKIIAVCPAFLRPIQLRHVNVSTLELIFDLIQWYSRRGDGDTCRSLVRSLPGKRDATAPARSLENQTQDNEDRFWQNNAKEFREMAMTFLENDDVEEAKIIFEMLDKNAPLDSSLQWTCGGHEHMECRRHISGGGHGLVYEV
jgi:hypothetical protein